MPTCMCLCVHTGVWGWGGGDAILAVSHWITRFGELGALPTESPPSYQSPFSPHKERVSALKQALALSTQHLPLFSVGERGILHCSCVGEGILHCSGPALQPVKWYRELLPFGPCLGFERVMWDRATLLPPHLLELPGRRRHGAPNTEGQLQTTPGARRWQLEE